MIYRKALAFAKQKYVYVFVTTPIIIYWVYWTLNPSYWYKSAEPAVYYFVDSLSVFAGKSYVYVDHPGTPLQLIGTFLLALTYPFFESRSAFINFFIAKPEAFFLMAHAFLLLMNVFCAIVFYATASTTLKNDRTLGAIALTLLYFALHPRSYDSLTLWSHNSFNFPFGTLWLLWLFRELRGDKEIDRSKLVLLGFASGALSMAQIYFTVWMISGIFTIFVFSLRLSKALKRAVFSGLYMLLGGVFGILLMLAPIYHEVPRFANWVITIITHQGDYGAGDQGIVSYALIQTSLKFWYINIRPLMLILLFTLIVFGTIVLYAKKSFLKHPGIFAMISGLLLQMGLLLLALIKGPQNLSYSLSIAAVLPVLILLVLKLSEALPWERYEVTMQAQVTANTAITLKTKVNSILKRGLYGIILSGVAFTLARGINIQKQKADSIRVAREAISAAIRHLAIIKKRPENNIVVIYAYAVPLRCAGLLQARNWTGSLVEQITSSCPNQNAIYDTGRRIQLNATRELMKFRDFTIMNWDLIVWPNNGSRLDRYLYHIGAVNIPPSWVTKMNSWFFIHPQDIGESP